MLLPRRLRHHVRLLYAYCRYVDDLGDEALGNRLTQLDEFAEDVERCYTSTPHHPLLQVFQPTIAEFSLPKEPLLRLIEANRIDQRKNRYETYNELLSYCQYSANPVGHLFLALLGYSDDERKRLADATCTALQLVNFWQDVAEDYEQNRIYIPLEDMERFQVTEQTIADGKATSSFRQLLAFQCERAEQLFYDGLPLTEMIRGIARIDVKLFSYGGLAVLDELAANEYNVFQHSIRLTKWRKARLVLKAVGRLIAAPAHQPS